MGWQLSLLPLVLRLDLIELFFVARDLAIKVRQDLLLFTFLVQFLRHILLDPHGIRFELVDLIFHFNDLVLCCLALLNFCLVPRARDMMHEVEA